LSRCAPPGRCAPCCSLIPNASRLYEGINIVVVPPPVSVWPRGALSRDARATRSHWGGRTAPLRRRFLAMNARMGARPWLAHTQYQYATCSWPAASLVTERRPCLCWTRHSSRPRDWGCVLLKSVLWHCLEQRPAPAPTALGLLDDHSPCEVEVLRPALPPARATGNIADGLCISLSTVASHVRHILTKTGVPTAPKQRPMPCARSVRRH